MIECSVCGTVFNNDLPCPSCGKRVIAVELSTTVESTVSMVAHKPSPLAGEAIRSSVGSASTSTATATAVAHHPAAVAHEPHGGPNGEEVIRVGSVEYRATANDGVVVVHGYTGEPPQNETGVQQACDNFTGALQAQGEVWPRFVLHNVRGIDAISTRPTGEELKVQVTRPLPGESWRDAHSAGNFERHEPTVELVAHLSEALQRKFDKYTSPPPVQLDEIVILLDATLTPAHTLQAVRRLFDASCRTWAAALRFKQVWVVGPTASLTYRIV